MTILNYWSGSDPPARARNPSRFSDVGRTKLVSPMIGLQLVVGATTTWLWTIWQRKTWRPFIGTWAMRSAVRAITVIVSRGTGPTNILFETTKKFMSYEKTWIMIYEYVTHRWLVMSFSRTRRRSHSQCQMLYLL